MRYFLCSLLFAAAAPAQVVSFGFTGGVPVGAITGIDSGDATHADRWTVGPSVEIHLVAGLSFASGFLFSGYHTAATSVLLDPDGGGVIGISNITGRDFDFPLLAKYRFGSRPHKPFVEGGFVWRHQTFDDHQFYACFSPCPAEIPNVTVTLPASLTGAAAGVGEEFRLRKVRIAPEVRMTYISGRFVSHGQLAVLCGFLF